VTVALVAVALDQATKLWAASALKGKPDIEVISGFFNLHYTTNPAMLFSIGLTWPPALRTGLFLVLAVLVMALIVYWQKKSAPTATRIQTTAFGIVMGGALGNTIDRLYMNEVIDFLDVTNLPLIGRWPTFNVADVWIVIGAVLLIFTTGRKTEAAETKTA
jgi:signal peptidase II